MVIEELLEKLVKDGGSDLHISSNLPPAIRVDGKLTRVDMEPLTPEEVENLLFPMLSNEQRRTLEQNWELDFSYGIEGLSRFRVNFYNSICKILNKVCSFSVFRNNYSCFMSLFFCKCRNFTYCITFI